MRIAIIGDCDTYAFRGLERPRSAGPYRLNPVLNLARGFTELGVTDVHYLVVTPEVARPTVTEGPLGTLHRLPSPRFSGTGTFHLWRRAILLRALARVRPDLVHGQGTEREYALTAVTAPYPHVVTFHGIMHRVHEVVRPPAISVQHVARWLEKLVARRARHVISISRDVEEFLKRMGSPARCYRIPNAMAPCYFGVQPEPPRGGERELLYVGTIGPRKGLLYLVQALSRLPEPLAGSVRLRVVGQAEGDGAYQREVQRQADASGWRERVSWEGVLHEQDIARLLARTDIFVLPSFWENMPMCIGEALAAGVPVISTRAAGIPDWVADGETGRLVQPGDAAELAAAIGQLLTDEELRRRMGQAGRAFAAARYAPRVVAGKTLEVYARVAGGGDAGHPVTTAG